MATRNERNLAPLPEAAVLARRFVTEQDRLDALRRAEVELMVSELVTNALRHARLGDQIMTVAVERTPTGPRVSVEHPASDPIEDAKPGFGFTVLDRLASNWGHEWIDGNLRCWFQVRAPGSGAVLADLTDEELIEHASSDSGCREEVIRRLAPLATKMARRYRGKGVALEDLEQVALMGMVKALERFDPQRGAFEPFASATMSGELKRYLRDRAWSVRVPRGLQERSLEVSRSAQRLSQKLGRSLHPADIAHDLGLSQDEVIEALGVNAVYRAESLDAPDEDSGRSAADLLGGFDPDLDLADHRTVVERLAHVLPERERHILYLRFFEDLTQSEIASVIGISQMHVSRLLSRSLARLKSLVE